MNAVIAFIDESGLMMHPLVRRSWAPCGQTPILHQKTRSYSKVSAIAAVTVAPQNARVGLYFCLLSNANFKGDRIVDFLRHLRQQVQRPIVVVWDRLMAHRGGPVKRFLRRNRRVHIEFLPPYAPELNPVEPLWGYLKMNPLANFAPTELSELHGKARRSIKAMQRRYGLIRSFLYATPLFFCHK